MVMKVTNISRLFILITILIVVSACSSDTPTSDDPSPDDTVIDTTTTGTPFVIGDIGANPDVLIPFWQPLANEIASNLDGYTHGEVVVASDIDSMSAMMSNGEVDLYLDSSYPSIIVSEASGSQLILRQWLSGVGEYHSIFFAMADSGYTSIEDLENQTVAFDKAFSTSGFFLPSFHLISNGYQLTQLSSLEADPAEGTVGYIFSNDDVNTINWVISGRVAAGVTDSVSYSDIPEDIRSELVILGESDALPRQLVSVRADMDEALIDDLVRILTEMDDNTVSTVLSEINTTQFDPVPDGVEVFSGRVNDMLAIVRGA